MKNRAHITAEWARKTAETQLGVETQKQFETCLKCIEEEVKKNQFSATVYFSANKNCLEELKKTWIQGSNL